MSQIKVGDLVQIVRPKRCCGGGDLGFFFFVDEVGPIGGRCLQCGDHAGYSLAAVVAGEGGCVELYRLKRIPPLDELEREQEKKELTA